MPTFVVHLRGPTVAARYRCLPQTALFAAADIGEASNGAGFDYLIGGGAINTTAIPRQPRFQPPIFGAHPGGTCVPHAAAKARSDLAELAEFELRRRFDAAATVWRAALAMKDLHRALVLCMRHVDAHVDRILTTTTDTLSVDTWIEAARIRYQSESMCCLAAIVWDAVGVILGVGNTAAGGTTQERTMFRRTLTRTMLCLHQRLAVSSLNSLLV